MENFREKLAGEIKNTPKQERADVLEQAKQSPEYWQARTEKIHEQQDEEEINDGLGVFIKKKTLYHGSATEDIQAFNEAEETTVGHGVYLTSEAKDAIGYARRRARHKPQQVGEVKPVIYELTVEGIKLLNLRKDENVKKIVQGFKVVLEEELKKDNIPWFRRTTLQRAIDVINQEKVDSGKIREVAFSHGKLFTDYVTSLGYDGLITYEGGEGDDVKEHDSYVIFDPSKAKIVQEHQII